MHVHSSERMWIKELNANIFIYHGGGESERERERKRIPCYSGITDSVSRSTHFFSLRMHHGADVRLSIKSNQTDKQEMSTEMQTTCTSDKLLSSSNR